METIVTADERELMAGLLEGKLSRNSSYELFSTDEGAALHHAFLRLKSLAAQASIPGAKAFMDETDPGGMTKLHVVVPSLGYKRTACLSGPQLEFLLRDMGGRKVFKRTGQGKARN